MSEARFGEIAGRLAGHAGLLLGWRPDEFWNTTPAELAAILTLLQAGLGPDQTQNALSRAELDAMLLRDL